jgi:hypothetical protein
MTGPTAQTGYPATGYPVTEYPVQFSVDYPDRPLSRLSTAFRLILVIPIAIVLSAVNGWVLYVTVPSHSYGVTALPAGAGGTLVFGPLLMILFRRKSPRWWFDWNLELQRFVNRVGIYLSLMDDRYPAADERQSVHLDYAYPDHLNRWLPLVKWLLAIPHLHRAVLPRHRLVLRGDRGLVRHLDHRPLPPGHVRFRRGRHPLERPGHRLHAHPRDRPLPPIPASALTGASRPAACR